MTLQKPPLSPAQLAQAKVLVVGDVMLDRYWYGAVDRISPEAPVPVVRISREENRLGGCANVAFNAVSVGAKASLLSVVGDDEASHLLQDLIAKSGITPYFGRDAQLKTTVKLRVIGRQQQLLRVDFENTPQNEVLSSQTQQFMQLLPDHPVVLFSDYGKGGLAHITDMIAAARKASKAVFIDPKGSDFSRYAGASCITPNRAELQQVVGAWTSEEELKSKVNHLRKELRIDAEIGRAHV